MPSWLWTKLMPPVFTASRGDGSQRPMKDAQISWLFIPAARRWERPAPLVTASGVLRDLIINRCRPFIFAIGP